MSAVLGWVLRHKLAVGFTIAVAGFVGSYVAWLSAHDELVATRAVANERLADFEAANERAEALDSAYRMVVTSTTPALARMDSLRARADSLEREAKAYAREASARLTKAGDSLAASLASIQELAIKAAAGETLIHPDEVKPLVETARRQHREERRAQNELANALDKQLSSYVDMLAASDSTSRLWERRYDALKDAYEARVEACRECRETVEAMAAGQGSGWGSPVLYTGVGALVGAVLFATFGP